MDAADKAWSSMQRFCILQSTSISLLMNQKITAHAWTFKWSEKSTLCSLATIVGSVARIPPHKSVAACAVLPLLESFVGLETTTIVYILIISNIVLLNPSEEISRIPCRSPSAVPSWNIPAPTHGQEQGSYAASPHLANCSSLPGGSVTAAML